MFDKFLDLPCTAIFLKSEYGSFKKDVIRKMTSYHDFIINNFIYLRDKQNNSSNKVTGSNLNKRMLSLS